MIRRSNPPPSSPRKPPEHSQGKPPDHAHGGERPPGQVTEPTPPLTPTSTALASSVNPSNVGDSVILTATLTGGGAGMMNFYDGATLLGTSALVGAAATFSTAALAEGSHNLTAAYGGDATHETSTSPILVQIVDAVIVITGPLLLETGDALLLETGDELTTE